MGRLWIDASVARKPRVLSRLTVLAVERQIDVLIHAHVHLELCRHLRGSLRGRFSPSLVQSYLTQRRIRIEPRGWSRRLNRVGCFQKSRYGSSRVAKLEKPVLCADAGALASSRFVDGLSARRGRSAAFPTDSR
jgi:hypothetical protein